MCTHQHICQKHFILIYLNLQKSAMLSQLSKNTQIVEQLHNIEIQDATPFFSSLFGPRDTAVYAPRWCVSFWYCYQFYCHNATLRPHEEKISSLSFISSILIRCHLYFVSYHKTFTLPLYFTILVILLLILKQYSTHHTLFFSIKNVIIILL